jgi:hypothetical protein
MKFANLGIRFLLELCILFSVGYWGYIFPEKLLFKIGLCIGAPLIIAIIWGTFLAPKASVQLPRPIYLLLEIIVFGIATLAIYATGHPVLAALFAIISVINRILLIIFE